MTEKEIEAAREHIIRSLSSEWRHTIAGRQAVRDIDALCAAARPEHPERQAALEAVVEKALEWYRDIRQTEFPADSADRAILTESRKALWEALDRLLSLEGDNG